MHQLPEDIIFLKKKKYYHKCFTVFSIRLHLMSLIKSIILESCYHTVVRLEISLS